MNCFSDNVRHMSEKHAKLDWSRFLVRWKDKDACSRARPHLRALGLHPEAEKLGRYCVNHTPTQTFLRSDSKIERGKLDELLRELGSEIKWVAPVYFLRGSTHPTQGYAVPPTGLSVTFPIAHRPLVSASLKEVLGDRDPEIDLGGTIHFDGGLPAPDFLKVLDKLEKIQSTPIMRSHDAIPLVRPHSASEEPVGIELWTYQRQALMVQMQCDLAWGEDPGTGTTSKGSPAVHVCVIDTGFDLENAEFARNTGDTVLRDIRLYFDPDDDPITSRGIYLNADATTDDKDHPPTGDEAGAHGTAVLGLAAATWHDGKVVGVAGRCSIFALKTMSSVDASSVRRCLEKAINEDLGSTPPAKRVVVLPGTSDTWQSTEFDALLDSALSKDHVLIIAPAGNADTEPLAYPATHPAVMTVGAVGSDDMRAEDSIFWVFSQGGDELSVVAPGLALTTVDLAGDPGYSHNTDPYPDHVVAAFNGTCGAAALTLGAAAALFSRYPSLTASQVRAAIERSAEKVHRADYAYVETTTNTNPHHHYMGYGRVSLYHAVDFADMMIRDNPTDTGVEPATGNMWRDADVVIRPTQEAMTEALFDTYQPDASKSRRIKQGQDNYVYVRVRNLGPGTARNVSVTATIAAPSTGFGYPDDWYGDPLSPLHGVTEPTSLTTVATLAAGASAILERRLPAAEADKVAAWGGHGCVLAAVLSANDYAFTGREISGSGAQRISNNLVQRNVNTVPSASPWKFSFLAGSALDVGTVMTIEVSAPTLGAAPRIRLLVDEPAFPKLDLSRDALKRVFRSKHAVAAFEKGESILASDRSAHGGFRLLDRGRIETSLGGVRGVLTLEPGSVFRPGLTDDRVGVTALSGADVVLRDGKREITIRATSKVRIEKKPNQVVPMIFEAEVPRSAKSGDTFPVEIVQKNVDGVIIGGISLLLTVS